MFINKFLFRLKERTSLFIFLSILLLFISIFLFYFSTTTSPHHPNNYGFDSAYYRFIGASVLKGKVPYKDIWDNKGPILYFIEAIGALHGTRNEKISVIFLLQIFSLFVSSCIMFAANREIHKTKIHDFYFLFCEICAIAILGEYLTEGNLTEEWSIPFISLSLFLFLKYSLTNNTSPLHPKSYAFIHGITLASLALIRINNAVSIFAGIAVIIIYLMIKKQWKNLIENIIFGILGASLVIIPVFLFYLQKHALGDMLYAVFIYNLNYTSQKTHIPITGLNFFLIRYSPLFLLLLLIIFHVIRTRKWRVLDIISLTIVISNIILLYRINIYTHYFIIVVPVFLFVMIIYTNIKYIPEFLCTILLLSFYLNRDIKMFQYLRNVKHENYFATVTSYLPKTERDSVIAIEVMPGIYLNTGLTPISRFAAYQHDYLKYGNGFEEEFISDLKTKRPKWIIASPSTDSLPSYVVDLLNTDYELKFSDGACTYNRLKEP